MSNELPKKFSTWVEFYDAIVDCKAQFENEVLILPDGELQSDYTASLIEVGTEYSVPYVKDNALEELLSDRFEREEAIDLFGRLRLMLYEQMTPKNQLGNTLSRLKRIILTQAKKESCQK